MGGDEAGGLLSIADIKEILHFVSLMRAWLIAKKPWFERFGLGIFWKSKIYHSGLSLLNMNTSIPLRPKHNDEGSFAGILVHKDLYDAAKSIYDAFSFLNDAVEVKEVPVEIKRMLLCIGSEIVDHLTVEQSMGEWTTAIQVVVILQWAAERRLPLGKFQYKNLAFGEGKYGEGPYGGGPFVD